MLNNKKIEELLEASKRVINDATLSNGAIVAANTDKGYYPRTAKDYRKVWPRDAAYVCIAADYLNNAHTPAPLKRGTGLNTKGGTLLNIQEPYFKWLEKQPEDFQKEGLLLQNYSTNGKKVKYQFQPDQMGVSLFAIWHHFQDDLQKARKYEDLIRRIADGLCNDWKEEYFFTNTADLWEEQHRITSTRFKNNFTYSLSACVGGLEKALLIFPNNENWSKAANEMMQKINEAYSEKDGCFYRNHGKIDDKNVDASLLGLVWPFSIISAKDKRIKNTVKKMEERIVIGGGVHRYELDYYDGEGTAQEGAGAWPLLNFWMAIYWAKAGNKKKAEKYFNWVIDRLENNYIPEQIFGDFREGKGVTPLVWSHAMFIIAFYEVYCS